MLRAHSIRMRSISGSYTNIFFFNVNLETKSYFIIRIMYGKHMQPMEIKINLHYIVLMSDYKIFNVIIDLFRFSRNKILSNIYV